MRLIPLNICSEVQKVSSRRAYYRQTVIAMNVIIMALRPILKIGKNSQNELNSFCNFLVLP